MGSPDKARQDSILTEIHSLAPYFTYDQSKRESEENAQSTSSAARSQAKEEQRSFSNWEKQRKEYVFRSNLDYWTLQMTKSLSTASLDRSMRTNRAVTWTRQDRWPTWNRVSSEAPIRRLA